MESTAWEMTVEHLGSVTTEDDILRFRAACARYLHGMRQAGHTISEIEATNAVWGDGDYVGRMMDLTPDWPTS
jgi:hypothetical protein